MKKELMKVGGVFAMMASLLLIANKTAFAGSWAECRLNGRIVPCEQLAGQMSGFFSFGVLMVLMIFGLGIWATVFWILMIIHVAKYQPEDQAMWIILMVFTGIIGAMIYYFAVKRNMDKMRSPSSQRIPKNK